MPSLKASYQDFVHCNHSLLGKGMYRLFNPEVLQSTDMLDARLKMVSRRDRLILKLSFLRHALQYSYGMHTASMVFEEIFTDEQMVYLNILDMRRQGRKTIEEDNPRWHLAQWSSISWFEL